MAEEKKVDAHVVPASQVESRDWYAWNDLQPPGPARFHIVGEVRVGNPGVEALLVPRVPQGINPSILLLDLILKQQSGTWPQIVVWVPARYDKVRAHYTQVQVFHGADKIADVQVQDIH
jgi:hypothetical protein